MKKSSRVSKIKVRKVTSAAVWKEIPLLESSAGVDECENPNSPHVPDKTTVQWRKATDAYHRQRLRLAEELILPDALSGDLGAIQRILLCTSEALEDGAVLSPAIAGYVGSALKSIFEGQNANDAFGIKRNRGEKDNRKARQRAYMFAHSIVHMRRDSKLTLEASIAAVASANHVSEDTVKRAWKLHHKDVRRQMDLEEQYLGKVIPITLP